MVVKFIRKSKVLIDCWTEDEDLGRVPLEISLLTKLNHPNVVSVSMTSMNNYKSLVIYDMEVDKCRLRIIQFGTFCYIVWCREVHYK